MAASVPAKKSTPDMPVFSYAQAAKGLTSSTSDTKQTKPDAGANSVDENTADQKIATTAAVADQSAAQQSSEVKNGPASADGEASAPAKTAVSERASPSLGPSTTSTLVKEDDISITPNGTASESEWEKQSQVSTAADKDKASQAADDDKAKSEASWENVTPPPKELKAAPPPTVNIWQQRQEALEAKAKANALLKPAAAPTTASKGSTASQTSGDARSEHHGKGANKKKASEAAGTATDASANGRDKKKPSDGSRKGGVRSNRGPETGESLPPVNDASSWPTPQLAQGEDMRKAQEHTEKPEKAEKEKHSSTRTHGKEKWMPVPYVPTAVFNTPLPPAARRGGRSARGGSREGGPRGAGHASGDRTTPSSASKASSAGDREKIDERATPEAQKGAPTADASLKNGDVTEKHTSASTDAQKDAKPAQNSNNAATTNASEGNTQHSHPASSQSPTRPRPESKTYHKSHEAHSTSYKGGEHHSSRQASSSADGHTSHSRYGAGHDRRFDAGSRSGEFFKDSNYQPRGREFTKDREFNRDGRDYQRSEYPNMDRESRSERGRGGYRGGRGGHSNYTSTTSGSQSATSYHSAPIPQHPFPPKGFNFNDRHRPQPATNGAQQAQQPQLNSSSNRMSMRSPSMPNPGMFAPYTIQTDMSLMYPYAQAPQGPMTAMPYQPYMENFYLMSMISTQLEYYFSVDNLCKDLFLRQHMDSQGFVLLSFIASFKRIKSLTEDLDLLRFVCRQLRNVEYRASDDGVDRLRKREGWQQWVLSMEARASSAQNDGPSTATAEEYVPTSASAPLHMNGNGTYNNFVPTGETSSAEEAPKRQAKLSSAAPEFSPLASNGTGSFEQANFTDGQADSNFVPVVRPIAY
ncbi:hypothetical protein MferCBS31731_002973 [Microsporum ferrugineum]